jgi:hypothetical protein
VVVQAQLHNIPGQQWEGNLVLAAKCLAVLEHCGELDPVACALHTRLIKYHSQISDFSGLHLTATSQVATSCEYEWGPYLLHIPPSNDIRRINLAKELLYMLCVPFGDPASRELSENLARSPGWHPDPTCYEHPQLIERLDCDLEKEVRLYNTGAEDLMLRQSKYGVQPNMNNFLGHSQPHGWSLDGYFPSYNKIERSRGG